MDASGLSRVFPYLYLGSQKEARRVDLFNTLGITHVLVLDDKITEAFKKAKAAGKAQLYEFLVFDVEEAINSSLHKYFREAFKFIIDAKGDGNILVQCPTGDSRAAVFCMAFFMQLRKDLSLQDVYDTIKEARPSVNPHQDLLRQLQAFHQSLNPDIDHVLSQLANLTIATPVLEKGITKEDGILTAPKSEGISQPIPQPEPVPVKAEVPIKEAPEPVQEQTPVHESVPSSQPQPQPGTQSTQPTSKRYVCKNCRTPLFVESDLLPHVQGAGQTAFGYRKRGITDSVVTCTSYFLDEMEWMGGCGEVEGKLFCPVCVGRIGAFSWSGGQCSCGTWCTPSFRVSKARVDEKLQF